MRIRFVDRQEIINSVLEDLYKNKKISEEMKKLLIDFVK